ncbi:MAG: hypothetical protein JO225_11650 [Candidatus Eremiobacteraeota bacterium]|nr:hypothetical protein [Candidatus Eremiobacteraeota bacterium]MBV8644547.1 hypothetical protein [Candidatus Eremiobacteraeota bacterium]
MFDVFVGEAIPSSELFDGIADQEVEEYQKGIEFDSGVEHRDDLMGIAVGARGPCAATRRNDDTAGQPVIGGTIAATTAARTRAVSIGAPPAGVVETPGS